jgi:hypothetical protein
MTRLELLIDKRYGLISQLIEIKTWQINNPTAKADEVIAHLQKELDELQEKIERVRMDS